MKQLLFHCARKGLIIAPQPKTNPAHSLTLSWIHISVHGKEEKMQGQNDALACALVENY
jgi:hypothetical protein